MACEEQIIALFTSFAKKSYIRLDAVDYFKEGVLVPFQQHYAKTISEITKDGKINIDLLLQQFPTGKFKVEIKGV